MRTLSASVGAFILLGFITAFLPVQYWQPLTNAFLPTNLLQVTQLDGRLWRGKANFSVVNIKGELALTWSLNGVFSPIDFQLQHEHFYAEGHLTPQYDECILQVQKAHFNGEFVNHALTLHGVMIKGNQIVIEDVYLHWPYTADLPHNIQAKGYWRGGEISYPAGRHQRMILMQGVLFELTTNNTEQHFDLVSEHGRLYMRARVNNNGEAEATIMPALLNALGQNWSGDSNVPAFVMTKQLFE